MSRRLRPLRPRDILRMRGRRAWTVVVALLLVLAVADRLGVFGHQGDDRSRYHGKTFRVVKVVDGDTIDIDIPDGKHDTTRIRLWGVDTPEIGHSRSETSAHFGPEAAAFTGQEVLNQKVRIELSSRRTRDRYGRLLAFVYRADNNEMLNEHLVATGHAYADLRFDHEYETKFRELESRARRNSVGLWKDVTIEQMPEWRKRYERR